MIGTQHASGETQNRQPGSCDPGILEERGAQRGRRGFRCPMCPGVRPDTVRKSLLASLCAMSQSGCTDAFFEEAPPTTASPVAPAA